MFGFTALMCAASLPNGVGADVAKILLQRREVLVVHIYIYVRHINTNTLTSISWTWTGKTMREEALRILPGSARAPELLRL